MTKEQAFARIMAGTRDHARTPMQWSDEAYAGFSKAEPWIVMDESYKKINVKSQLQDENSILHFYHKLIALRRQHPVIHYGDVVFTNKKKKDLFSYYRNDEKESLFIEANLSSEPLKRKSLNQGSVLLSNYEEVDSSMLRPYEAIIWKIK